MDYRKTYYKYKFKYLSLLNKLQTGGAEIDENIFDNTKLSDSNHSFTIDLFDNLDGSSNIFSPISIIFCLSLLQLASRGRTEEQLYSIIGYRFSVNELKYLFRTFNNRVMKITNVFFINYSQKINEDSSISLADRMVHFQNNALKRDYFNMIDGLSIVINDYFDNSDLIISKINSYIERNTDGRIKDVIQPSDLDSGTAFVLLNTIYFKANWKNRFLVKNTRKMEFHHTRSDMIDMMNQTEYFNYYENNSVQVVELPYDEKDYVMGIILPKKYLRATNLDYSINNVPMFTAEEINEFINNLSYTYVDLYLPKFTARKRYQLKPLLEKMGLFDIFNENSTLDITQGKTYVNKIIHESVVIVDESGTEASSATVVIGRAMVSYRPNKPILFKANHAFTYYIRYVPGNLFLFYGDYQGN